MPIVYGLTTDGLVIKTLPVLRDELDGNMREKFGASMPLGDRTVLGIINGIYAYHLALVYELMQQVYSASDPNKAGGQSLDAVCTITGTFRLPAAHSTVTLTLCGTPTTNVGSGSQIKTSSTQLLFETTQSGVITALTAWAGATVYAVGNRRTNGGECYVCTQAGTSAGSGGPVGTDPEVEETDGTAKWRWIGTGTGAIDVAARSFDTGEIVAVAYDLTEIVTPVGGWTTVINLLDADLGRDDQTDEALRLLREAELASVGTAPVDALRADLLKVSGVTSVTVFHNVDDVTDVNGLPPHSVEALVRGGENQTIFDALFAGVAAGIKTYGNTTGTSYDSQLTAHTMKFSRPVEVPIYVDVTVIKNPLKYPADGDDQIKAAIVAWGDIQETGKDAVASALVAECFKVAGVLDVSILISTAPSPTLPNTIAIALRELATYDTSRIDVSASNGTP